MRLENIICGRTSPRRGRTAFTLVEMLGVMAIIAVLLGLIAPTVGSIFQNRSVDAAAYTIGDMFEQARSYAMGNNTYVFLGIAEYDSAQPTSANQTVAAGRVGGRVVVMAAASKDGTSIYDPNTLLGWTNTNNTLQPIMAPRVFDNVHIGNYVSSGTTSGINSASRPTATYNLGSASFTSSTPFNYPLSSPRYPFTNVIVFDPQGLVHLVGSNAAGSGVTDTIPKLIELDLQATHGNVAPQTAPTDIPQNYVALQCGGITGAISVFK